MKEQQHKYREEREVVSCPSERDDADFLREPSLPKSVALMDERLPFCGDTCSCSCSCSSSSSDNSGVDEMDALVVRFFGFHIFCSSDCLRGAGAPGDRSDDEPLDFNLLAAFTSALFVQKREGG